MADIQPFAALRPRPELAAQICELPYDVMSSEEARALAAHNPLSFLHVSKPEIDLPPGTDPYASMVYARGRENFQRLIQQTALVPDPAPAYHLYRQVMGHHAQTGIVAVASCEAYLAGAIKKHELTRVDKEDDRVRHLEALDAQTGPAFLLYRAEPALEDLVAQATARPPEIDFVAADGVRHSSWTLRDAALNEAVRAAFERLPTLYIADGHHRTAAAARVSRQRRGAGGSAHFLAVIFAHTQLQILPYHRVLADLNGLTPNELLVRLAGVWRVVPDAPPQPLRQSTLGLYLAGRWYGLESQPAPTTAARPVQNLDVSRLQHEIIAPIFGIADPRTSPRLGFVGGIRGTGELERLIDRGDYACAFSLFPTSVEDLMSIADAGEIMPPKSTWFEPKLRDGMFCHRLEGAS
ncbi:MAG: DUF1015 domain-containing protein [Verrucomicrobia bacterium]|nr:DUF1015 domain-containing protein [Verrucomicrobiota bacterium]